MPVATGASRGAQLGIEVGSRFLPMAAHAADCPALQVVALDRTNLAVKSNTTYACTPTRAPGPPLNCPAALRELASSLAHRDPSTLIVARTDASALSPAFQNELIGIGVVSASGPQAGDVNFAALGVPGSGPGEAQQSLWTRAYGVPLDGYLFASVVPREANDLYAFVPSDYPVVDTRAAGSSERVNVVRVGGTDYRGALPSGNSVLGGYHVLVLDRRTLGLKSSQVFETNTSSGAQASGLQQAAQALSNVGADDLAIVASVGQPIPAGGASGPGWDGLARQIARLGGTAQPFLAREALAGYSLLGLAGSRLASSPESSTAVDGTGGGRLRVVLVRDSQQRFGVDLVDVTGTQSFDLYQLAFSAPSAWPVTTTKARQDAYRDLSRLAGAGSGDIRRDYWARSQQVNWSSALTKINDASYTSNPNYSKADFDAVRSELSGEIKDLTDVAAYFTATEKTLSKAYLGNAALLNRVSQRIQNLFDIQPTTMLPFNLTTLVSSILLAGHMFIEKTSMGKMAATINVGLATIRTVLGEPVQDTFSTPVSELGVSIFSRYTAIVRGMNQLEGWIVGDWKRLTTTASLITCTAPGEPASECQQWQPTNNDRIRQEDALTEALQRSMYEQLVGLKLRVEKLPEIDYYDRTPIRKPKDYVCGFLQLNQFAPYGKAPDWSWSYFADNSGSRHVFVALNLGSGTYYPGKAAMDALFGAPDLTKPLDGPLGFYQPYLYLRALQVSTRPAKC